MSLTNSPGIPNLSFWPGFPLLWHSTQWEADSVVEGCAQVNEAGARRLESARRIGHGEVRRGDDGWNLPKWTAPHRGGLDRLRAHRARYAGWLLPAPLLATHPPRAGLASRAR